MIIKPTKHAAHAYTLRDSPPTLLTIRCHPSPGRLTRNQINIEPPNPNSQATRANNTRIHTMVLGLLILSAIPTVTGVAQGISSKKQENAALKEKIKFNMTAVLSVDGGPPTEAWIVLRDGRVSGNTCFSLLLRPPLAALAA